MLLTIGIAIAFFFLGVATCAIVYHKKGVKIEAFIAKGEAKVDAVKKA
jgi:hypothetical protein